MEINLQALVFCGHHCTATEECWKGWKVDEVKGIFERSGDGRHVELIDTRAVLSDSQCRLYQKVVPHRIIDEDYHYFTLYAPSYRLLRPIPYADR